MTATKGPLRYEDGTAFSQEDASHGKSTRRQSTEFLDSETSDDSSSSEDEQEEDGYEMVHCTIKMFLFLYSNIKHTCKVSTCILIIFFCSLLKIADFSIHIQFQK